MERILSYFPPLLFIAWLFFCLFFFFFFFMKYSRGNLPQLRASLGRPSETPDSHLNFDTL